MLPGKGTQRRSPHPYSLSQGREQEVHYRLLLWCIESHRFVIQYTASLCTAHTANPCTIFLSVFPPPPTVLLTSLHTGETEQLRKQPSGGKFLKVFWAHPTWGEHSKKNRKGWVGAPSAPTHKPGIVTPAHPQSQQGPTAGTQPQCPHTKICKCVFCEDYGMEAIAWLFQIPRHGIWGSVGSFHINTHRKSSTSIFDLKSEYLEAIVQREQMQV